MEKGFVKVLFCPGLCDFQSCLFDIFNQFGMQCTSFNKNASVFGNIGQNRNNPILLQSRTAGGNLVIHKIYQKKQMDNFTFNRLSGNLQSTSGVPNAPSSTPFLQLPTFRALLGAPSLFQRLVQIPKQNCNYVSPSEVSAFAEKPICPSLILWPSSMAPLVVPVYHAPNSSNLHLSCSALGLIKLQAAQTTDKSWKPGIMRSGSESNFATNQPCIIQWSN